MEKQIEILSKPAEVSMADEWFDIASTDHFWMQWRFKVISQLLTVREGLDTQKKYLEIGCGHGQFLKQCDENFDVTVDGCDLNLFALQKIKTVKGDIFVYDVTDQNSEMLNKYNGIFLLDVIEHIENDLSFLRSSINHLTSQGLVIINVPALHFVFSKYDEVAGHKRRYSKKDIKTLFDQCGIEAIDIRFWGLFMLPLLLVRKLYLTFIPRGKVIEKGFKPANTVINSLLKIFMKIELALFNNPLIGTSIVAIGRKK